MGIWVDADACPVVIKEILFKAAKRSGVQLTLVANQHLQVPAHGNVRFLNLAAGFDVADNQIVRQVAKGDLVITADIPLAAEAIDKGAEVITPRGERYTSNNIRSRLSSRDFMEQLRAAGVDTGGPAAMKKSDRQSFANHLDHYLGRVNRAQ